MNRVTNSRKILLSKLLARLFCAILQITTCEGSERMAVPTIGAECMRCLAETDRLTQEVPELQYITAWPNVPWVFFPLRPCKSHRLSPAVKNQRFIYARPSYHPERKQSDLELITQGLLSVMSAFFLQGIITVCVTVDRNLHQRACQCPKYVYHHGRFLDNTNLLELMRDERFVGFWALEYIQGRSLPW